MNRRYVILCCLMLLFILPVHSESIWIISDNYQVSYVENAIIQLSDTLITISDRPHSLAAVSVTSQGYTYQGLEEYVSPTIKNVTFSQVEYADTIISVPTGDFPIALPTKLNDRQNWLIYFGSVLTKNETIRKHILANASFNNVEFNNEDGNLNFQQIAKIPYLALSAFTNLQEYSMYNSLMINELRNIGGSLTNITIDFSFIYSGKSGILYNYNLTLIADEYSGSTGIKYLNPKLHQELLFAVVLPPINSESLNYSFSLFALPLIVIIKKLKR